MLVYARVLKKKEVGFYMSIGVEWCSFVEMDFTFPSCRGVLYIVSMGGVFNIGRRDYDLTYTHIVHIMSCTADIKNCCNSTNAHIHRHIHIHVHIHIHMHIHVHIQIYIYISIYIYIYILQHQHIHIHIHSHIHIQYTYTYIYCACISIYIYMYVQHTYMYPNKKMGFNIWGQERLKCSRK